MMKMAPRRNNLFLFFLYFGDVLMGRARERVALFSCRSSDPVRFVSDDQHMTLPTVVLVSAIAIVF